MSWHSWVIDVLALVNYTLDGATVAAIGSYGPNGEGLNNYDDDDIVLVLPAE